MKVLYALPILFIYLNTFAFSKDCSSFDSRLKYYFDSPDGGAPRGPNENLTLNGQVLINENLVEDSVVRDASIIFADQADWESKPDKQGDYVLTKSVVGASVFQNSDKKHIFSDLIFCQTTIYTGEPLP